MKFRHLQLRTSLSAVVFCLSLLTLVAVAIGWYNQQQDRRQLESLMAVGVKANSNVKKSYIDALLAMGKIDDAMDARSDADRTQALREADGLLASSRLRLKLFLDQDVDAAEVKDSLKSAFSGYWSLVSSLAGLAKSGEHDKYLAVRQEQAGSAIRIVGSAFSRFDLFIDARNRDAMDSLEQLSQRSGYACAALVALAVILALMARVIVSRTVLRPLKRVGQYFDHIAAGDLTQRIEVTTQNEIGVLYAALRRMQESLAKMVGAVRSGTTQIAAGAQSLVAGNVDLSGRTEEQAAALEQTAASMNQLAGTVKQNADNAHQANQLAATASDVARRGGEAVSEVVATMEGISGSSRKIADIVGVIDSIAFQTNILALNAAVEAARAGAQGKGFAVVAAEVRALAQRSAQAAKEIKGLIEDSVSKVSAGSGQVARAGQTMQEIVSSVARVTDIMEEIASASGEQSSGIDEINRAVAQMDEVTRQNMALVERAAESATCLGEQIRHVTDAVSMFKVVDNQVIDVSAAAIRASEAAAPAIDGRKAVTDGVSPQGVLEAGLAPEGQAGADALPTEASARLRSPGAFQGQRPAGTAAGLARPAGRSAPKRAVHPGAATPSATRAAVASEHPGWRGAQVAAGSTRAPAAAYAATASEEEEWVEF
jgi:methyl-accepting chemotaxis protein-2 (aspartate sensor receptor)